MTVSKNNSVNNYAGNNSVTRFDFDFLIEDAKELLVQHTNSLGVQTTLILDKDYTINEIGNKNGSYITFPLAESDYSVLADDEIISLSLELDIEQDKEYANSSKLNFITLEWSFDYITRILQTMSRKIARSVKVQEGSTQTADQLVEALQQAQVNASASASAAVEKAVEAANSAITASEQAQIATQTASQLQSQTMQININTQNIATKADTSLDNLTDDGKAKFDGDWVSCSEYQIFSNVGLSSSTYSEYTLDFLPDNGEYELMCNYTITPGASNGYARLYLADESETFVWLNGLNSNTNYNTQLQGSSIVVIKNKKIKAKKAVGGNGNERLSLTVIAYRKLGVGFATTNESEVTQDE